jgi:hypothetical protein
VAPLALAPHQQQQQQQQQQLQLGTDLPTRVRNQQECAEQIATQVLQQQPGSMPQASEGIDTVVIQRAPEERYIERQLVSQLVARHAHFMQQAACARAQ